MSGTWLSHSAHENPDVPPFLPLKPMTDLLSISAVRGLAGISLGVAASVKLTAEKSSESSLFVGKVTWRLGGSKPTLPPPLEHMSLDFSHSLTPESTTRLTCSALIRLFLSLF